MRWRSALHESEMVVDSLSLMFSMSQHASGFDGSEKQREGAADTHVRTGNRRTVGHSLTNIPYISALEWFQWYEKVLGRRRGYTCATLVFPLSQHAWTFGSGSGSGRMGSSEVGRGDG